MELSQKRTLGVLQYVLSQRDPTVSAHLDWLREHTTANGLSFSKRIMRDEKEDREASRRVEFRVRTQAERQIRKILEM
ncbi:MAG: hypothetical protein ETSY2_20355 [Candidatus Entotheonella gemina]|uniref:Uncharacterized protein n=1 Tax=Candidatus Entotheonella gemina TaxID=1429439 RepID=W4M6R4_9BACT|nr:MAG: hypothetical protein ETSY2_20355 [Candidatus Entotheonella gemina]